MLYYHSMTLGSQHEKPVYVRLRDTIAEAILAGRYKDGDPLPSVRAFADSVPGGFDIERGNAFEVDAEVGTYAPGIHALGELAFGDYDRFADSDFMGASGWLAYRTGAVNAALAAIEPLVRASYSTIDGPREDRGGTLLTPGINFYFGGLNRVMANYDIWMPSGNGKTQRSFKTQFQLAF